MKNKKPNSGVFIALVLFALTILVLLLTGPLYSSQMGGRPWLMQFQNGPVTVTFIQPPPDKGRTIEARLIAVETSGLVLRLPKEKDKFYPFSNMITVDPK